MNNYYILPTTLLVMAALAGCSTMPENSRLNEARNDYSVAQSNPQVVNLAPSELKQAGDALAKANDASTKKEDEPVVTHLAYLAKQRVAIAQATAKQKEAEIAITNASAERSKIRLEARTEEANKAQLSASASQRQADASQQRADSSQRQAETSQQNADASLRQATTSQQNADASQRQAETSQQQAAMSQQQLDISQQQTRDAEKRTGQLEVELKDLNAKQTERGLVITLGDVLFDTNKAQLKPGATRSLQKLADFLKEYPERQAQIEGYTDSTGSAEHNQELSERRADAVRMSLVRMGISTDRIITRGYGPDSPVAGNDTPTGRQMNRRVEIILSDENGNVSSTRR